MAGDTIIKVEGLAKSYRIFHQRAGRKNVTTDRFTSVMANALAEPMEALWGRLSGKPAVKTDYYEDFWALNDVSFEINQGDVVGVMGRNGAGKSTLLKVLSRITEPTKGRISIEGRVASLLEVGTGFHGELTGRENIYLNGAILGMYRHEIRKKFDEIVAFAEIEKFLDTPVKRYSSGMYVRLAFAVAAHLEPEILIIDEVLAVGDAQFQKKCLGKMQDVSAREGRTVLFVSHSMGTVATLCSKGIYLKGGRVEYQGDTKSTIDRFIHDAKQQLGEETWDDSRRAPGSDNVRFKAVRVISGEETTSEVEISKDIHFEVEYEALRSGLSLSVSLQLVDQLGMVVFTTMNLPSAATGSDAWMGKAYAKGSYRSRCTLPANFLNEGSYNLHVSLLTHVSVVEARVEDVVSFNVHETGEMRREHTGPWPGIVRPRLAWHNQQI